MSSTASPKYRPEIDGLRCVAVCAVVLYHAGFSAFSGGYVGVDVFFVISGYVITTLISQEIKDGTFTFSGFYMRRVRRIFPALFLLMLVCLPFAWVLLTPGQMKEFSQSIAAVTLFASNIYFFLKSGYFGANAEELPLLHTWSLAVEEQFYVIFPIILLAFHAARRGNALWAVSALTIASFGACLYFEHRDPLANFFLAPMRAWELFAGALLAMQRFPSPEMAKWFRESVAFAGFALLAVAVCLFDKHTSFPGLASLVPIFGTVLLIQFATPDTSAGRLLSSSPFVKVGLISYGFYLWHQPMFAFARAAGDGPLRQSTYLLLIVASLIVAYASWKYVEMPARRSRGIPPRKVFAFATAASFCFLIAGTAGHVKDGFASRFASQDVQLSATAQPSPKRSQCHAEGAAFRPPSEACVYFASRPDWAVLGDSHAVEPAFALAGVLQKSNRGLIHLSFSGCQPALLFESNVPGCSAWLRQAMRLLQQSPDIRHVLVVFRHSFHLFGDQTKVYPEIPNHAPRFLSDVSPDVARKMYWESFRELVVRLRQANKVVYVLGPIPELPRSVERYVYRRKSQAAGAEPDLGTSARYFEDRNAPVLKALNDLPKDPGIVLIDAKSAFCGPIHCYPIVDGTAMYFDDNHLSVAGAERLIASSAALQAEAHAALPRAAEAF